MNKGRAWDTVLASDLGILILLALAKLAVHLLTNGQYGFHRDELGMLEDARYLAWGFVSYPPVTPFIAHLALALFGPSLIGLRFFSALAISLIVLLAGLIVRNLGGGRRAQIVAALAVAISPVLLAWSAMFSYGSFDTLWWVLLAYLLVKLLNTQDPRYWLLIGAVTGLGMLTKYSMAFCAAGLAVGVLFTPARRQLASPWLWAGVLLSLLIFLPNVVWQVQHDFIHLQFLSSIHARDISIGRTHGFLLDQLYTSSNPVSIPLWVAGAYYFFFTAPGKRYRALGWLALVPFALFLISQGRGYYTAPIYPILIAGGAVYGEQWLATLQPERARRMQTTVWRSLAVGGLVAAAVTLPIAPINSAWWGLARAINPDPKEEIGWPDLVREVANIYAAVPAAERPSTGILAGYSEVGAINLYGPAYGLPRAIGGGNSDWLRGYGDPPPQVLIVVGWSQPVVSPYFDSCSVAGMITNSYGVQNEDTLYRPDIFICRGLRDSWPDFWQKIRSFA